MRTFIAISVPDELGKLWGEQSEILRQSFPTQVKWLKAEALHITLVFIGETSTTQLANLEQCLSERTLLHSFFELITSHVMLFNTNRQAKVVYISLAKAGLDHLFALQKELFTCFINRGLILKNQNFVPHITLGRIKKFMANWTELKVQLAALKLHSLSIPVQMVHLMESIPTHEGSHYQILRSFPLRPR